MKQANLPYVTQRRISLFLALTLSVAGLTACDPAQQNAAEPPEPGVLEATRNGPPGAAPGTCWGKTVSPAVVERVSGKVLIKPAITNPDGTIGKPPVYRRVERQVIVTPRKDNWFETPCPKVMTPDFIASLQRALQVRGGYAGAINGQLDPPTRTAVKHFQMQQGLESSVLSLATARTLGLIAVPRSGG